RHRRLGLSVGHAPAVLRVLRPVSELADTFLAHPVAGDVVDALLVGAPAEPLAEVGGVTRDRVGDLPPDGLELLALARVHAQPYHDAEHALGPGHRAGGGSGHIPISVLKSARSSRCLMRCIWMAVLALSRSVMRASSNGASGRISKSWTQRIRVAPPLTPGTSSYSQKRCMYLNQPGSTRCARTVRVTGSGVRSETQLQTLPSASGCMVSRNRIVGPWRCRISAAAYSLNSRGQDSTSLVASQTRSIGRSMTMWLSVWPAIAV